MKAKIVSSFLTLSIILFNSISCKAQSSSFNDKEITSMLKNFYTSYIVERSKMPEDFKKIDSILKKYGTKNLQNQIKNEDIDYDLLLNGQFCEKEWLNTMSINKDNKGSCIYKVSFSYIADGKRKQKSIKLQIVKDSTGYKINKVIE
jgi:hypothetical protein